MYPDFPPPPWVPPPAPEFDYNALRKQAFNEALTYLEGGFQHRLDDVYAERNQVVALAAELAWLHGLNVGLKLAPDAQPGYNYLLFIDLPTGQVSWHLTDEIAAWLRDLLPVYVTPWDNHTTAEKYQRIRQFITGEREDTTS